ncbi:UDP-glucuronosyltransferase 2C1 microsomal [Fusarium beomiforme]|uniref:UDP-glucuronosyltransferase 2C1 microsomal n=1 Tax=Fusarium beomiforme TaxID=44412 RepID=A0A9P5A7Z1_9HYPO|nr:UDP-glucuronosyltransferase 2C1 microsomal [Fusarium beomiforme]
MDTLRMLMRGPVVIELDDAVEVAKLCNDLWGIVAEAFIDLSEALLGGALKDETEDIDEALYRSIIGIFYAENTANHYDADKLLRLSYSAATKVACEPLPAQDLPSLELSKEHQFDLLSKMIPSRERLIRAIEKRRNAMLKDTSVPMPRVGPVDVNAILEKLSSEVSRDNVLRQLKELHLYSVLEVDAILQDVLTMLITEHEGHEFRRRILLLVTTGGFTHAAPVLEIGAVLASRGHDIQFATCEGQEGWAADYPFIKTVYTVGPAASEDDLDVHYESMRLWRHEHGFGPMMKSKYFFDNFWTDTYKSLRVLCQDEATRPDFIVADFFADSAARDMLKQFNIQLASVWPQMPYAMAPVSYHPGQPGFQADGALTSEHASLSSRFWNELVVLAALPIIIPWLVWTKRMRVDAGVNYSHSLLSKPDYLVLVNSFWGLEAPKELPPLMTPVGPILSDEYPRLDEDLAHFLSSHDRTIYVCLGTHVNLPGEELVKYLLGFIRALDSGSINGVIWSVPQKSRVLTDSSKSYHLNDGSTISIVDLLNNAHPRFRLPIFAPQRAILAHPNTALFLTHGGGSSVNEALFHGTPVLAIGYFFDQLCNSARLKAAGVGISLDKSYLTPSSISSAIANITTDEDGTFARNSISSKK